MNEVKQPSIKKHRIQNPQWSKDTERLILYADFMGFKNRVLSKTHEDLKKELCLSSTYKCNFLGADNKQ